MVQGTINTHNRSRHLADAMSYPSFGSIHINTHIHTFQVRLDLVDLNNSCYDCWSETPAILQVDDRTKRSEEVDLEGSPLQEVTLKKLPELSLYYRFFIVFLSRSSNIKTIDLFSPETQVSITYDLMYVFLFFSGFPEHLPRDTQSHPSQKVSALHGLPVALPISGCHDQHPLQGDRGHDSQK